METMSTHITSFSVVYLHWHCGVISKPQFVTQEGQVQYTFDVMENEFGAMLEKAFGDYHCFKTKDVVGHKKASTPSTKRNTNECRGND